MDEKPTLQGICDVLGKVLEHPHYRQGTPDAIAHLLVHVATAIEIIDRRLAALEETDA